MSHVAAGTKKWDWLTTFWLLACLVVVGHVLLTFPVSLRLRQIHWADEAVYLNSGRMFAEGHLPAFESNPLVAGFYAVLYLPIQQKAGWFTECCGVGRVILLLLLWSACMLIARELADHAPPLVLIGMMFVSPAAVRILGNPSDALFAALSGFGLWQVLAFVRRRALRHLAWASAFIGLSGLARNDGLVLFPVFMVLAIGLAWNFGRICRVVLVSFVPFVAIVGGYVFLYASMTGHFHLGTMERTYLAFEQGQGMAFEEKYRDPATEGIFEARRLFGTGEENRHSVSRAITRNPQAFAERVVQTLRKLPRQMVDAYGNAGDLGFVILLFAARGVIELARRKTFAVLSVLLLWTAPSILYLALWVREGYLQLPMFSVLSLAAVGTTALVAARGRERTWIWSILLCACVLFALATGRERVALVSLCVLLALWIVEAIRRGPFEVSVQNVASYGVLCVLGLSLRESYPIAAYQPMAPGPEEEAVDFLRATYAPNTPIAAWMPRDVAAATMMYVSAYPEIPSVQTERDLQAWLAEHHVQAIYVDRGLRDGAPQIWQLLRAGIDKNLAVAFTTSDETIEILAVRP